MNVNHIRYADDTERIADLEEKHKELVETIQGACAARGLHNNFGRGKTEGMGLTKSSQDFLLNISLEVRRINQKERYNSLAAMVTKDGKCEGEVLKRTGMSKNRFNEMR